MLTAAPGLAMLAVILVARYMARHRPKDLYWVFSVGSFVMCAVTRLLVQQNISLSMVLLSLASAVLLFAISLAIFAMELHGYWPTKQR